MLLTLEKLRAWHVSEVIERDPTSQYLLAYFSDETLKALENDPNCYTIMLDGKKPLIVGGVSIFYIGRGEAWTIMDQQCKPYFLPMHKIVKRYLDSHPLRRIEATCPVEFTQGHRWLKLLGFELEAPRCRAFSLQGNDHALYARVREIK